MIVILNGASASGRTGIAKAMQQIEPDMWVHVDAQSVLKNNPVLEPGLILVMRLLADMRHHLIIEETFIGDSELRGYVGLLSQYPVAFVGLKCPIHILDERNALRDIDERPSLIEKEVSLIHPPKRHYDLVIHTDQERPFIHARRILAFLENNPNPSGFKALEKGFKAKQQRSRLVLIDGKKAD